MQKEQMIAAARRVKDALWPYWPDPSWDKVAEAMIQAGSVTNGWVAFEAHTPTCLEVVLVHGARGFDLAHGTEAAAIPGATHWMRLTKPTEG